MLEQLHFEGLPVVGVLDEPGLDARDRIWGQFRRIPLRGVRQVTQMDEVLVHT